jgi:hypothetical protein
MTPVTVTLAAPGTSRPIRLDEWADAPVGGEVATAGAVNYTVQHSLDEGPDSLTNPIPAASMFWDTGLLPPSVIGATIGTSFSIVTAPLWIRIVLNSGSGSVRMVVNQYGPADE